ncbi:hypothetical protein BC940DRAFT_338273 [Gongronella butleri]|nr:hypothetical protein BC940DRAFT_338273 [Gongronella butleri]
MARSFGYEKAEQWIARFDKKAIPTEQVSITFSRSSGPGGQNVNKVSTKVDMRLHLQQATWIPEHARERLKTSPLMTKAGDLQVTSMRTRSQGKNVQDCYDKLVQAIKQAVAVPRPADPASLARLEKRQNVENVKRKDLKRQHGQKKAGRRSKGSDF